MQRPERNYRSAHSPDMEKSMAAYITVNETINIRVGSMKWAKSAAIFSVKGASR